MMATAPSVGPVRPRELLETELTTRSMGGTLRLRVVSAIDQGDRAERDLRHVADRVDAWARRLTRFDADSDLSLLNKDPSAKTAAVRPTLAAVLSHAQGMATATGGMVDVTMLDERIAAETGHWSSASGRSAWSLSGGGRHCTLVRYGRARFDLDGVAKGWIADRALRLLDAYRGALVDADGDLAMRAPQSAGWHIVIGHPFDDGSELARVRVPQGWRSDRLGIATSGTSVHRWSGPAGPSHHLIDPRTGRPAVTDVVQASVIAASAGVAECLAKSAVIRGSQDGLGLLERAEAWGAVLLLEDGDLVTTSGESGWLD